MYKPHILIVDDSPDIREILKLTLQDHYRVSEANDGESALDKITNQAFDLVILDYKMPKMDGRQVCLTVKKDLLLSHLPIIMVTGKGEIADKVEGIDAGADDYIVKPFEPQELLARIKMVLRRTERDLDANPLTRLPGNISILNELNVRLDKKTFFAVCYIDLDKFKAYNDHYGFEKGDKVIREVARILLSAKNLCGNTDDFIGHIGGDDFVYISDIKNSDKICHEIIKEFDKIAPLFYDDESRKEGFIIEKDRQGTKQKFPLLTISIGVVDNKEHKITHVAEIGQIGAELKSYAKTLTGSNYVKNKRKL